MGKPNVIGQDAKPGHQHGTRWRAHAGGGVGLCEQHTVARQLIDVGGHDVPIAVRPKHVGLWLSVMMRSTLGRSWAVTPVANRAARAAAAWSMRRSFFASKYFGTICNR